MTHVTSGMKHLRVNAQFFVLKSSAAVNNDDPDDRGSKSVSVLERDWHGIHHSADPRLCVA